MFQITEQQIENRWNVLPLRLLEILCSFDTGKMILEICKKNHIIGEKSDKISGLTGFVIMGFLHPEDLAQEIKEAIGVNAEIADSVSRQIERRIFLPLRSEIDKIYSPVPGNVSVADKLPLETTEAIDLRIKKEDEPETPKIVKSEDKEREKTEEEDKPFIIHKEESSKPILGAKRSLGGLFGFLKGGKEAESKAVEAKIEIGRPEIKAEQAEPPKMKVIHYSEFRTPIDKMTNDQRPTTNDTNIIKKQETDNKILDILEIEPPKQAVAGKNIVPRPLAAPPPPPLIQPAPLTPQRPEQNPKFEAAKESEEVIDLRTMKKINE